LKNPFSLSPLDPEVSGVKQQIQSDNISGLHIIANFNVADQAKLISFQPFRNFISEQIVQCNLSKVGEVYHNFENGGYTAIVCLTESHLSIHTWPERNYLTFDIFLSNYMKDNRDVTREIYQQVKRYFNATIVLEQTINR
jgi:S-adenosylmethionine decarboxylase